MNDFIYIFKYYDLPFFHWQHSSGAHVFSSYQNKTVRHVFGDHWEECDQNLLNSIVDSCTEPTYVGKIGIDFFKKNFIMLEEYKCV